MELYKAHRQWAARPADERFTTLKALYDACKAYAAQAGEKTVTVADIRVEADKDEVVLVGKRAVPAQLTHWAFGQVCARVGAPASYMRDLPATLAVQNLNYGLAQYGKAEHDEKDRTAQLLFHQNGGLLLRAFTSEQYARIWNWEVAERLLNLENSGWEPARPDFNAGPDAAPALYASDHDMFTFLRNRSTIIREPGNPDGLQRGVIVENSEVGASALKLTRFLYRAMCGNHIIWGASKVLEIKVRHVGHAHERWAGYQAELQAYLDSSASDDEAKVRRARAFKLGDTKEEVLDRLFGIRGVRGYVSQKLLDASYDAALPDRDGSPNTVWGMVQGMTRYSQQTPYADQRTAIDRAAGRLMEIDF